MRIVILGGNGFIGCNLANCLVEKNYEVISFDIKTPSVKNKNIEYIEGDFFDETDILPIIKCADIVVHAVSTINPGNSNVKYMHAYSHEFLQSVKLAQYSVDYNFRLIYLSSGGTVYGYQKFMPISEETLSLPINHYGNIKLCIENTYRTFNIQLGSDIKIARISNPYGPGQDYKKGVGFLDAVLKRAILGEAIEIYGTGNIVRDYIYISDVCEMIECLMCYKGKEEVFNIGTGIGVSQNEVISIVEQFIPKLDVKYIAKRSVDTEKIILNTEKINKIFNKMCISINKGIGLYYHYIKENS